MSKILQALDIIKQLCNARQLPNGIYGLGSHPLINSNFVMVDNKFTQLTKQNKEEIFEKLFYSRMTTAKSFGELLCFIQKPYKLEMLNFIKHLIDDDKEYNELFRHSWQITEFPHLYKNKDIYYLLSGMKPELIMTSEELSYLKNLPDNVEIYRGTQSQKAKIRAFSWTLKKETAEWFANRWKLKGKLYKAKIPKSAIYFYSNNRKECEVVLNPRKLRFIEEIKQQSL